MMVRCTSELRRDMALRMVVAKAASCSFMLSVCPLPSEMMPLSILSCSASRKLMLNSRATLVVMKEPAAVTERVKASVIASGDKFAAVLQGEDEPWDVALVELWRREVERSAGQNIRELNEKGKLFG